MLVAMNTLCIYFQDVTGEHVPQDLPYDDEGGAAIPQNIELEKVPMHASSEQK